MLYSIARLIRFEKSFLSAVSVFLPVFLQTNNINLSLGYALPIFTICAAGYVINDINDIERDHINNPDRVLPKQALTTDFAAVLYYVLLGITLVLVKFFIPFWHVFVYMFYLVLISNYTFLVNSFAYLKNIYVLVITAVHLSIIFLLIPVNFTFITSILLNILGQEILLDLRDIKGDGNTFPKVFGERASLLLVVCSQILQTILLLLYQQHNMRQLVLVLFVIATQVIAYLLWKKGQTKQLVNILKAQTIMMFVLII